MSRLIAIEGGHANERNGHRTCRRCGSSWWTLVDEGSPGQVCIDEDGVIVAWTGAPHCGNCGVRMHDRPELREVEER